MKMITEEIYNYTKGYAPRINRWNKKEEVLNKRLIKSKEESMLSTTTKSEIQKYVVEFLKLYGIREPLCIELNATPFLCKKTKRQAYLSLQKEYNLLSPKHIVWLKFAQNENKEQRLGVVCASDDINFNYENTSGKLIKAIGYEWCYETVLICPLAGISDGMRRDLETGIGNYLSNEGVPILDFYSHRYQ